MYLNSGTDYGVNCASTGLNCPIMIMMLPPNQFVRNAVFLSSVGALLNYVLGASRIQAPTSLPRHLWQPRLLLMLHSSLSLSLSLSST
jgi:hypothetical protein